MVPLLSLYPLSLQTLFNQYQFSEEQVLPPTALRNTLAILHRDLDRFQPGKLDDAAEAMVRRAPPHRLPPFAALGGRLNCPSMWRTGGSPHMPEQGVPGQGQEEFEVRCD